MGRRVSLLRGSTTFPHCIAIPQYSCWVSTSCSWTLCGRRRRERFDAWDNEKAKLVFDGEGVP